MTFFSTTLHTALRAADTVVTPLATAHSHNDYHHQRPLFDALDHGFCNVEADVFLVDGQLLVGHERSELRPGRTLQTLYLDPLLARVQQNQGSVHKAKQPFMLLIDFKTDGPETYAALREILPKYREMLSSVEGGHYHRRAIDIVISGNRPHKEVAADVVRYAFIDGRVNELTDDTPWQLVPLVSDNWSTHFQWRGEGEMPEAEKNKLHQITRRMHDQHRRLRFWATPETPEFWDILSEAEVDLIGTDDLPALQQYLLNQQAAKN